MNLANSKETGSSVVDDFHSRLRQLDVSLQEAERLPDPVARERLREIARAILEVHGAGLARLLEHVRAAGPTGDNILKALVEDDIVAGLLVLHELHPLGLEERVAQALESVRPYLRSHGGSVLLLDVLDGAVRLRLTGSCQSCPSSAITMQQTIEEAILSKAPEVTSVMVLEGGNELHCHPENRVALPLVS
jgi:Fe-S cluster biogenesis protein NfuA